MRSVGPVFFFFCLWDCSQCRGARLNVHFEFQKLGKGSQKLDRRNPKSLHRNLTRRCRAFKPDLVICIAIGWDTAHQELTLRSICDCRQAIWAASRYELMLEASVERSSSTTGPDTQTKDLLRGGFGREGRGAMWPAPGSNGLRRPFDKDVLRQFRVSK